MAKILAITPHLKWDCLATTILEGLTKLDVELYCTDEGNGAINIITDAEFVEHYPTTDYILALSSKKETPPPRFYLIDKVDGWDKTAYCDGSEYNFTSYKGRNDERLHPLFKDKAHWYFKRDSLPEEVARGIIPIASGGAVDADFSHYNCEKDIDVLCAFGHTTTGLRAEAVMAVRELAREGYKVITSPVPDYLRYVARSWITIEARGGGPLNARAWQIMANQSAMFAQKYNEVIPNLEAGRHYVEWSSGEELRGLIRFWLEDKDLLDLLIGNAYENLIQHHTSEARARYILEKLSER